MKSLAIIIPIYQDSLSKNEKISLEQAMLKFRKFDIYFVAPNGLRINSFDTKNIEYKYFDSKWFKSVGTYSELMLNSVIYRAFESYKYILIYQLDAFVFSENIKYFLDLDLDYIGAPTLEGMYKPYRSEKVLFTQNGGFSLRKVSSFIEWTEKNKKEIDLMSKYDAEDSIIYALRHKGLKLASESIALKFSFDSNVRECYRKNNNELPLGCHAWERYDYDFWKPYIESLGYYTENPSPERLIVKDYYNIEKNTKLSNESLTSIVFRTSRLYPPFHE